MDIFGNMDQVVWITGGSQGIGRALVQEYRRKGWTVIATSRQEKGPHENGVDLAQHWVQADLSQPEARKEALQKVLAIAWPDLVIFNAGVGHWAPVSATKVADADYIFQVNYWTAVDLTYQLQQLQEGRPLHIVAVTSIAAHFGQRKLATYSATKAALRLWALSLNEEWQGSANRIQVVSPGVVTTDIMRNTLDRDGNRLGDRAKSHHGWSPEKVAQKLYAVPQSAKFEHIFASFSIRLALILHDLCPRLFYTLTRRRS
jgi:NAD(P)-dependent dehydrogenase (short-subunit alcohol dehydrogenase family)